MKLINKIFLILLIIFIFPGQYAVAGDVMSAGTVLENDSYVFTIDEAQRMLSRIKELELKELKLSEYEELSFNLERQNRVHEEVLKLKELQIKEYKDIVLLTDKRLKRVERQEKMAKIERWAFLALGIGLTVGGVLVADKIDDYVESN